MEANYTRKFEVITELVRDLADFYGNKNKPLQLYVHLINRTEFVNKKPIQKHIDAFRYFCVSNRDKIIDKKLENFTDAVIKYSDKVYLDMNKIMELVGEDKEVYDTICSYLLTLSALLDPASKAKQILVKEKEENKKRQENGGKEQEFLSNIIKKVESSVNPDMSNPMEAIAGIMSSGLITDLVSGMSTGLSDGSLNLDKLIGSVQGLVSQMNESAGDDPESARAQDMANTLMGNLRSTISQPQVEELDEQDFKALSITAPVKKDSTGDLD